MPEYLSPGVYVEEVDTGAVPIAGVGTSTAGFLGETERGPTSPKRVTSFAAFRRRFGGFVENSYLAYAVEGFFRNGGSRCYVGRITAETVAASATLPIAAADGGTDVGGRTIRADGGGLRVNAIGPGSFGENIAVVVGDSTLPGEDLFSIRVLYWKEKTETPESPDDDGGSDNGGDADNGEAEEQGWRKAREELIAQFGEPDAEEVYDNLSTDEVDSNYYGTTINSASKFVQVTEGIAGKPEPTEEAVWLEVTEQAETNGGVDTVSEPADEPSDEPADEPSDDEPADEPELTDLDGVGASTAEKLRDGGFETVADIRAVDVADLIAVEGISENLADRIKESAVELETDGGTDVVRTDGGNGEENGDEGGVGLKQYQGIDTPGKRTGLAAFKEVDEIAIVCAPDHNRIGGLATELVTHCENMGDRFAVLQADQGTQPDDELPPNDALSQRGYAAIYYPWIKIMDPETNVLKLVPPGGHVAGIYARSDTERGVYKAPANEMVRGAQELELPITKGDQAELNPKGVNCIRSFRGRGILVWGARTTSSNALWKYVNVRRLFLYLEESIDEGTQWVVFEPNDDRLWARVRQSVGNFLTTEWRNGALQGSTPEEAFYVKCDRSTMTQDDIDNGRLICEIGVAPVKPAEFVIFRITQWTGDNAAS